ncbi:MAG: trehalase family glycosidase [Fibrobacterota bacterium]
MSTHPSKEYKLVHEHIESILPRIERRPTKGIPFPYLAVAYSRHYAGFFYCWDHHHMAMRFACAGKPEYLRHGIDNMLYCQRTDGFTPFLISPKDGANGTPSDCHAQPFVMQGALMYISRTGDTAWLERQYDKLLKYLRYYELRYRAPHGLFRWTGSVVSGFDNDVVTTFFQPGTIIPVDINAWLYLEYRSASGLARLRGKKKDAVEFLQKAKNLRAAIQQTLWYAKAESYSAYDLCAQEPRFHYKDLYLDKSVGYYAFQTCSNLIPLYAGIPDNKQARAMLKRYVLSEKHFLSPYGIRSLSRSSEYYNNAVWGNPPRFGDHRRLTNSNWQGPVWIPLCYFMFHALRRYGFRREAADLAGRTIHVLAQSLARTGSFTENFHGDTGEPLYAPGFASWNILADLMPSELKTGRWIMEPVLRQPDRRFLT